MLITAVAAWGTTMMGITAHERERRMWGEDCKMALRNKVEAMKRKVDQTV